MLSHFWQVNSVKSLPKGDIFLIGRPSDNMRKIKLNMAPKGKFNIYVFGSGRGGPKIPKKIVKSFYKLKKVC